MAADQGYSAHCRAFPKPMAQQMSGKQSYVRRLILIQKIVKALLSQQAMLLVSEHICQKAMVLREAAIPKESVKLVT